MRVLGYLAFLPLVACAADSGDYTIELTHDACAPIALVSATPTAVQSAGLDKAQSLWRDRGVPAIGLRAGATVEVRFDDAAPLFHGLYDDKTGVIYINNDLTDETTLSIVIAHELGHALGLLHITGRPSVMNPGNLTIPPNAEDQAALEALWGPCSAP
ncbi:MAG: matrixin family metalloprotease [Kofleriaceae bacterium]|nr:matrixin family metalloprotease [Kofleriaceae bacterium]